MKVMPNSDPTILILAMVATVSTLASYAQEPKKTRDQLVLEDRDALEESAHWIYNDLDGGFAEAKRTGKPLLVVHRCIP